MLAWGGGTNSRTWNFGDCRCRLGREGDISVYVGSPCGPPSWTLHPSGWEGGTKEGRELRGTKGLPHWLPAAPHVLGSSFLGRRRPPAPPTGTWAIQAFVLGRGWEWCVGNITFSKGHPPLTWGTRMVTLLWVPAEPGCVFSRVPPGHLSTKQDERLCPWPAPTRVTLQGPRRHPEGTCVPANTHVLWGSGSRSIHAQQQRSSEVASSWPSTACRHRWACRLRPPCLGGSRHCEPVPLRSFLSLSCQLCPRLSRSPEPGGQLRGTGKDHTFTQ